MSLVRALRDRLLQMTRRRRHPRRASTRAVDWHVFGSGVHHVSALLDLSPGGARVRAAYPRPVGSPIVLYMPRGEECEIVHARVAWSGRDGMGLRFSREIAA